MPTRNRLKEILNSHNVSYSELARRLEMSQAGISYMCNEKGSLSIEKCIKICDMFDISLDYLFYRK